MHKIGDNRTERTWESTAQSQSDVYRTRARYRAVAAAAAHGPRLHAGDR